MAEEETTVTVEHDTDSGNDETPSVVVVDTGDDSSSDTATLAAIAEGIGELRVTVANLSERLESVETRAAVAEAVAETASDIATEAVVIAEEVAEEAEEVAEEATDDAPEESEAIEPDREHWMWQKPIHIRRGSSE